ncbi:uncharacterized protein A1O9_10462 [Exophiala aquamarina CBS 119918]|uniref:Uncharacterized protein n=1 Tax=Exophiala aquamarina CBS 119918 TaxID=1182545 RepID=A0A072P1D4_9EURO|nr:uncharacterized protein A1O9_10462 [Exophiala aquamarina CBS 119918]KEF53487.1 hypothetical protein A1O9_10462 [Exophiala aquamarina CBS 119918]
MSQPEISQTETNEHVGEASGRTPNGVESTDPESGHIDTVHFGIFHDQLQAEVQRLQEGMSISHNAVTELSKTFGEYSKIVSTVGERHGKDQVLEDKIRDLEATNAGIWKNIETDRSSHKKVLSDLRKKHDKELSGLLAQAEAGELEKEKYEEMERSLQEEHDRTKQGMARELKHKKNQLENENAEKIANLERKQEELESEKARLEHELDKRTAERDQEMETRETMQNKARTDIRKLEKSLADIQAKYQVDQRPSQFYEDRYKRIFDGVGKIASLFFTELPDKAIDDPVGTSARLKRKAPSFASVPIGNFECSQVLRLANAQHVIFDSLCGSVWQPFFSRYLWKYERAKSSLPEIYSRLAAYGEDFQQNWKVSTLKILEELDDKVDVGELVDTLIEQTVIDILQPLLDDSQLGLFKDELKIVYNDAIELGRIGERDQSPVYPDTTASVNDRAGWKEYLSEDYDMDDAANLSRTSSTSEISFGPLFVSPKMCRKSERVSPTPTAATPVTTLGNGAETEVILPGVALFPNTGIFQEGAMHWRRIQGAGREIAKNINGVGRRPSTSTSMKSLGSAPASPREPSKRWPRQGTRDFD